MSEKYLEILIKYLEKLGKFKIYSLIVIVIILALFKLLGDDRDKSEYLKSGDPFQAFDDLLTETMRKYEGGEYCFALNPFKGYEKTSCLKELHPVYGTKVMPFNDTLAVILTRNVYERFIEPKIETEFFAPNGIPYLYYYRYPDGRLEIFSYCGYHPLFNKRLKPITETISFEIYMKLKNGQKEHFVTENDFNEKLDIDTTHYLYKHRKSLE